MNTTSDLMHSAFEYSIECLPEDMPFVGNCMASGDDEVDAEAEQWIRDQLDAGNEWAWCCVKVTATFKGLEATDYLGGCSYKGEADFKSGGYYDDMIAAVTADLKAQIAEIKRTKI